MTIRILKLVGLSLLVSLLLVAPAIQAGGWATITLDDLPTQVVTEQPVTIGFVVRHHGQSPMADLSPIIKAVQADSGESFTVTAAAQGKIGHYSATLIFPRPGAWNWSIQAFTKEQSMPQLIVEPTALQSSSPPAPFLLMGVIGLLGTVGTATIWWRKRAWWAIALSGVMLAIGATGFIFLANRNLTAEAHSAQSVPQATLGAKLFVAKGCVTCHHHTAMGQTGNISLGIGPNLTGYSTTPEYLRLWLKDPRAIKPKTVMPNLELKENEIEALIAFLLNGEDAGGSFDGGP